MSKTTNNTVRYRGRIGQIWIYLGRLLRLFVTQSDWKVLPMSVLIAGLVAYVIGKGMFVTQERTLLGSFALACICIWNGCFNSIQVICRERAILKREHRAGMHVSSYIVAQMIYQALICAAQASITTAIFYAGKVQFPAQGLFTSWFVVDFSISLFLATFAADMLGLAVSAIVKDPTTAMTVMPFLLIFELIFSGGMVTLSGNAEKIEKMTTAHWAMNVLASQGDYNELPFVSAWNTLNGFRDYEYEGIYPVKIITDTMTEHDQVRGFQMYSGAKNAKDVYTNSKENIGKCWRILFVKAMLWAVVAGISLERIDKDKR